MHARIWIPHNFESSDSTNLFVIWFLHESVSAWAEICNMQGRRNEKSQGAENLKKAHCYYFELKPGFIDGQWATAGQNGVFRNS